MTDEQPTNKGTDRSSFDVSGLAKDITQIGADIGHLFDGLFTPTRSRRKGVEERLGSAFDRVEDVMGRAFTRVDTTVERAFAKTSSDPQTLKSDEERLSADADTLNKNLHAMEKDFDAVFKDFDTTFADFDKIFSGMGKNVGFDAHSTHVGTISDLKFYRKGDDLVATLDIPGVRPADVKVRAEGTLLTVTTTRLLPRQSSETRTFSARLPAKVTKDHKMIAACSHGVLTVTIPGLLSSVNANKG